MPIERKCLKNAFDFRLCLKTYKKYKLINQILEEVTFSNLFKVCLKPVCTRYEKFYRFVTVIKQNN